jgi:hypothetical protein
MTSIFLSKAFNADNVFFVEEIIMFPFVLYRNSRRFGYKSLGSNKIKKVLTCQKYRNYDKVNRGLPS